MQNRKYPFKDGPGDPPFKNPVAKFNIRLNRGGPLKDRKRASKNGYAKHKGLLICS